LARWKKELAPFPLRTSKNENKHHLFPLCYRAEGRQQCEHVLHQVCVKRERERSPPK
jgi:hypothetical protein